MSWLDSIKEIFQFLMMRKKWWLVPLIIALIVIGFIFLSTGSGLAPFIYSLF
jgi:hypothetical protein